MQKACAESEETSGYKYLQKTEMCPYSDENEYILEFVNLVKLNIVFVNLVFRILN